MQKIVEKELDFKYEEINGVERKVNLEYEEIRNNNKFQTVIYLPFLCKSSWTKTEYYDKNEPEKLEKRVIEIINSKLKSKYDAIKIRDYNNRKRFKKFKKLFKALDETSLKKEYSNGLNHKDKIGESATEEIRKELDKLEKIKYLKEIDRNFKFELSWSKFIDIIFSKYCSYCGLSIKNVYELAENGKLFTKRARGYCLEVDQIDPYGNYKDDNCTATCYWCNNAKTDEFSVENFSEIAKGINAVWRSRDIGIITFDKIDFWKNNETK